ncbi:MAG: hypothetical protein CMN30_08880 [Sandaracinus sp.]|nr:hypothetical protein [Sandaracinus sp.]
MSPRAPLLRGTLHALLFVIACRQAPEPDPLLLEESFEDECSGMACGWERIEGDADGAEWVSTVHPGEHGLRLQPGATVRRTYDLGPQSVALNSGAMQGAASARCDLGGRLSFELLARDAARGPDAYGGQPGIPTEWSTPISFSLAGDRALADGGTATGTTTTELTVTALIIRNGGTAPCAIDHLRIDGFGRAIRAPASSCDAD